MWGNVYDSKSMGGVGKTFWSLFWVDRNKENGKQRHYNQNYHYMPWKGNSDWKITSANKRKKQKSWRKVYPAVEPLIWLLFWSENPAKFGFTWHNLKGNRINSRQNIGTIRTECMADNKYIHLNLNHDNGSHNVFTTIEYIWADVFFFLILYKTCNTKYDVLHKLC